MIQEFDDYICFDLPIEEELKNINYEKEHLNIFKLGNIPE